MYMFIFIAVTLYAIFCVVILSRREDNNRNLLNTVKEINDENAFFRDIDGLINSYKDKEYRAKAVVFKLWGLSIHEKYKEIKNTLEELHPEDLIKKKIKGFSIKKDEGSFVYLFLIIPEILYRNERTAERKLLSEKLSEVDDKLAKQFCRCLSRAVDSFFERKDDRGLPFFEKVLGGDYGDMTFSKKWIGLYQQISGTMAAALYKEAGDQEKYDDAVFFAEQFCLTALGKTWVRDLGIETEKNM